QRLRFQHHALAAAKRPVVDSAVTVFGERPQILNVRMNQCGLARPADNSVLKRACEKLRKNGDEIKSHSPFLQYLGLSTPRPANGIADCQFKSRKPSGSTTSMRRSRGSIFVQISTANGISSSPCEASTCRSGVPATSSPGNLTSRTVPSKAGASASEHGEDATAGGLAGVSKTLQPIRSETKYCPAGSDTRCSSGKSTSNPRSFSASEMEFTFSK